MVSHMLTGSLRPYRLPGRVNQGAYSDLAVTLAACISEERFLVLIYIIL